MVLAYIIFGYAIVLFYHFCTPIIFSSMGILVQLSTPAPNTITQSLTATGTIQWAAGSLFYLPEGLLVEAVFVSEGEAVQEGDKIAALRREDVEQKLRSLQAELAQKQTEYARLTKPVAADSYDLEKAQQALQAAYQAAENSAAAWAEKEANAGSERDALQRELNERQEKAAQYAREIAEKQAQRELLQQEESPDEEIISRIEAELTQLTAEETQNREALAEAEARLNEADAALESVQSQREEAARTAAQAAEQAEQARNDARHAYEKSVEAASETAAANAASATVLAEQIREMESSVETLKKLDEQEGVFCAPQTGTVESLQLMQGQTSGQVGGSISDPERGYQIRFALEAEDAVQDTAGVTVTVMQGAKSESVKINSSVSQQDGGVVLSAALTGSDWQVGKAELTIRLSETEYDCCLPVSALHSDNGGDFVYSVEERNTTLYFPFPWMAALTAYALCPAGLVLLAAARTLGGRVRRGCPKETCWFVLGGAFLLALVLPALLRLLPPWITPARWSDFSYWGGLLPAVGKAIETGFSLNPCAKDVLAKWNTLGLLIAATLANAAAGKLMLSRQQKNSTNL